jgi:hypothetical protein
MSTSVHIVLPTPCVTEQVFVSRFPQSITNDTRVPAWAFMNVSVRHCSPFSHHPAFFSTLTLTPADYSKMGQCHCLRARPRSRVNRYLPPVIRTKVRQRRCSPRRRHRRRCDSLHGSGLCARRVGYMVLHAPPPTTATSVFGPQGKNTLSHGPRGAGKRPIHARGLDAGGG